MCAFSDIQTVIDTTARQWGLESSSPVRHAAVCNPVADAPLASAGSSATAPRLHQREGRRGEIEPRRDDLAETEPA